jgi:hypothetical protein
MSDEIVPPPGREPRRLFQPGHSRQSRGPAAGLAKQGDARRSDFARWRSPGVDAQSREAALAGDMLAIKLCLERVLPRCHERPVAFPLPSLAAVSNGEIDEPSPRGMNAVTTALACGEITTGEAATIARVYQTFVRTAGTARDKVARSNLLQIVTPGDDIEDEDEDIGDAEAIDDCDL